MMKDESSDTDIMSQNLNKEKELVTGDQGQQTTVVNGKFTCYLLFCILISAFGAAFQFGWSFAVFNTPSEVLLDFYRTVLIRRNQTVTEVKLDSLLSITNGMVPFGGIFGGLSSGVCGDYFGRKYGLILTNLLVIVYVVLGTISKYVYSFETLIIGRFICGLFCGLFSGLLPLYLSELAPTNLRGTIGTIKQLLIVVGILVTNILGLPSLLGSEKLWPILIVLSLVPGLSHLFLFFSIESPQHLVINLDKISEAKKALLKIRDNDETMAEMEVKKLIEEKERLNSLSQIKWSEMVTVRSLRRPLMVTVVLQVSQQFCGINSLIYYSKQIFMGAGLNNSEAIYATIVLSLVQLIMTFVCTILVDRTGRKILLFVGMVGISISSFALAAFMLLGDKYPGLKWIHIMTVISAVVYIVFFSIGPGAIPWLITPELFNTDARGKATSIAVFVNWFGTFAVTVSFIFIERLIGSYSFILFGFLSMIFALYIFIFVPETKNKPIDAIVDMFEKKFVFLGF